MICNTFNSFRNVGVSAVFIAILLLSACGGSSLDGTYSDEMGITELKFESGGKVYASFLGYETELEYEMDGDKLKIISPQGNQIYRLQEDGSFSGPTGTFKKKK